MQIGPIKLPVPFCQAGLAGYSDRAMRLVARRRGCPYAVTESLLDITLLHGGKGLENSIDINDEDHPIAGQIIGSEPDQLARVAQILYAHRYDVIDLNFACPVKKIKNKARGGHMLRDLPRAVEILKAVRDALPPQVPTTVSLRRGYDDSGESTDAFFQILETAWSLDYAAVRVHARTVEQKYAGPSRWPFLKDLKARYPDQTILGSGDVFTAEDAVRMLGDTGVDMVWIARGAIGNPWVFKQAAALLESGSALLPPSIHEQRDALREHFGISMEIHGEQLAGRRMRKQGIKYARFHPDASQVKVDFIAVTSLRTWQQVLDKWYSHDGPGVWPDPRAADEVNGEENQSCEAA
ncbi:MAG: tRNA-dihydrouridine synthase [Planctomycetota bacterium]|nr:tRNA-dihydrouridine synthase [Planctomycetota bacterium]